EEKTQERRPKAYLVGRRRGRGASRRDSRSEAEGTPKGLARPRSDSAPKGARGRLRGKNVRPTMVVADQHDCAVALRRGDLSPYVTVLPATTIGDSRMERGHRHRLDLR